MENLGTKIEFVAKPIALGIDAIWGSDLAGCKGCGTMRDNLNAGMGFWQAVGQRFKSSTESEDMQFQIQLVIEAESVREAMEKAEKGEGTVISVTPRPQQPVARPQVMTATPVQGIPRIG